MNINDVIALAESQKGYLAKYKLEDLDDFTAFPQTDKYGYKYTKYARDLYNAGYYGASFQGGEWCAMFMDWLFWKTAGENKEAASLVKPGTRGYSCTYTRQAYQDKGWLSNIPQVGDQAFIRDKANGDMCHTGLVIEVSPDQQWVRTLDGNVSIDGTNYKSAVSTYRRSIAWYDSFGHPNYSGRTAIIVTNNVSHISVNVPANVEPNTEVTFNIVADVGWKILTLSVTANGESVIISQSGRKYEGTFTASDNTSLVINGSTIKNDENVEVSIDGTNWVSLENYVSIIPQFSEIGEHTFNLYVRSKVGETTTVTSRSPYQITQKIIEVTQGG